MCVCVCVSVCATLESHQGTFTAVAHFAVNEMLHKRICPFALDKHI